MCSSEDAFAFIVSRNGQSQENMQACKKNFKKLFRNFCTLQEFCHIRDKLVFFLLQNENVCGFDKEQPEKAISKTVEPWKLGPAPPGRPTERIAKVVFRARAKKSDEQIHQSELSNYEYSLSLLTPIPDT